MTSPTTWLKERGRRNPATWSRAFALLFLVALALAAVGCGNPRTGKAKIYGIAEFGMPAFPESGANVVEIFNEMHYQPSYKSQEGPRLLPPPDSAPFVASGSPDAVIEADMVRKELTYATLAEYRELEVPHRVVGSYREVEAAELYRVNCMVCHGPTLKGRAEEDESKQAKILRFMSRGPRPEDLTSELTMGSTDGELFSFITRGGRQGLAATERGKDSESPMPEFLYLLTEEDRWTLVMYLRSR